MRPDIPLFKVNMPAGAHAALGPVLASGHLAHGDKVDEFGQRLAAYIGQDKVCTLGDVSGALTLALYLAGVRPGDEVISSPMVCLATSMPIANLFARPVWCDVDARTGMIDPARVSQLVGERTRAILAYNWSGDVADLDALQEVAGRHAIKLVVDASEAFGAEHCGRKLGAGAGDFTAYSFSAVRHITTGEGAALFFARREDLELAQRLRYYGIDQPRFRLPDGDLNPDSDIAVPGYNLRMNNIAAAIGLAQFDHADAVVARYSANGRYFDAAMSGVPGLTLLRRRDDSMSGYWTYALRVERREDLARKLREMGIGCQRLHLRNDRYGCFAASRPATALPGVDVFDRENLSIPCGWWVGDGERERIAACIRSGW